MFDRLKDDSDDGEKPEPPVTKEDIKDAVLPLAHRMIVLFPNLQRDLIQAKMDDTEDVEYLAECIMKAGALGLVTIFLLVFFGATEPNPAFYTYAVVLGPVVFGFGVFTMANDPASRRRNRPGSWRRNSRMYCVMS